VARKKKIWKRALSKFPITDMHPIPYRGFNGTCAEAMRFCACPIRHTMDR
jgi:hypothetical protein